MQRYFVNRDQWRDGHVFVCGDDSHHIQRVMRMQLGDQIICCDETGSCKLCKIVSFEKDVVRCCVMSPVTESNEPPFTFALAPGLIKGDKLDFVIQKATELGVASLYPFQAERSVVKWEEKKRIKKLRRWQKIAKEAAEQSERSRTPFIKALEDSKSLIEEAAAFDIKIVADESVARANKKTRLLADLLAKREERDRATRNPSIFAVVGPEGGFSRAEVGRLTEAGFIAVGLGPRILRAETASLFLLSVVSYHYEQLR